MKLAESVMRESWQTMIAKVEKYYPKSKNPEYDLWQFVISEKKSWMFDVINRVWCNMDNNFDWHDTTHPCFRSNQNYSDGYTDLEQMKRYYITAKRWLNGNTLICIGITDY